MHTSNTQRIVADQAYNHFARPVQADRVRQTFSVRNARQTNISDLLRKVHQWFSALQTRHTHACACVTEGSFWNKPKLPLKPADEAAAANPPAEIIQD